MLAYDLYSILRHFLYSPQKICGWKHQTLYQPVACWADHCNVLGHVIFVNSIVLFCSAPVWNFVSNLIGFNSRQFQKVPALQAGVMSKLTKNIYVESDDNITKSHWSREKFQNSVQILSKLNHCTFKELLLIPRFKI